MTSFSIHFCLPIFLCLLSLVDAQYSFTPTSASNNSAWYSVTCDDTGENVVAAVGYNSNSGIIQYSNDYGATWIDSTSPALNTLSLSSSSDGTYVLAATEAGVYLSSDKGLTWNFKSTALFGFTQFFSSAVSSSGQYLYVAGYNIFYFSIDFGVSFTSASVSTGWFSSLSTSSSGQYVVATILYPTSTSTAVYISSNYGSTFAFASIVVDTNALLDGSAMDSTGQYVYVLGQNFGMSYKSSDFGLTWSAMSTCPPGKSLTSDSTGRYLSVAGSGIFTSSNYGSSWSLPNLASVPFVKVASTSDATILYAANTNIYEGTCGTGGKVCQGAIYAGTLPPPTASPSNEPSGEPTTVSPTAVPSADPTSPTTIPTSSPSSDPTTSPSGEPTKLPSGEPSKRPSSEPTGKPSGPSGAPSGKPTAKPTGEPSSKPTTTKKSSSSDTGISDTGILVVQIVVPIVGFALLVIVVVYFLKGKKNPPEESTAQQASHDDKTL